jgi:exosortase C (VPDSG-CTERM-specific)
MSTLISPKQSVPQTPAVANRPPLGVWITFGILIAGFSLPLVAVARLALGSQVYSYLILMPFITGYLLFTRKEAIQFRSSLDLKSAVIPMAVGFVVLGAYALARNSGWSPHRDDHLAAMIISFVCFVFAIAAAALSRPSLRVAAFPLALMIFMAPFPIAVLNWLEAFLQHGSADVAHGMLALSGMPLVRDGTFFQLPGFAMQVAPECSGIRSTLALFITSLVAGYMLLGSPWRRAVLSVAIIPLALLRNGFRIWTISQLCVNVDPEMIHSFIHRKGGPIFFALSLIPFSLLLLWLIKTERKRVTVRKSSAD